MLPERRRCSQPYPGRNFLTSCPPGAIFRPAIASDANGLAELIYLAGQSQLSESSYSVSLGGSRDYQLQELAKLTNTAARSWFHYSHFEVAVIEGTVVGSAAGFDRLKADAEIPAALRAIGWTDEAIADLDEPLGSVLAVFPAEPTGFWTVDHVAVLPAWRGQGLARRCLLRVLDRGQQEGFQQCKLDFFQGNTPARKLYESLGFRHAATFTSPELRLILHRDAVERMTRAL